MLAVGKRSEATRAYRRRSGNSTGMLVLMCSTRTGKGAGGGIRLACQGNMCSRMRARPRAGDDNIKHSFSLTGAMLTKASL